MKIELHAHTSEGSPCGLITTAQLIQAYLKTGAQALVLTDHYSMKIHHQFLKAPYTSTYKKAKQITSNLPIQIFLGMEINLIHSPNDYLLYGLSEDFYDSHPELYALDLASLSTLVHAHHGLIFQAHPLRHPCQLCNPSLVDGFELNTSPFHSNHNDILLAWLKANLEHYPHLKLITGSDCHGLENIGTGMMSIPLSRNNQELVKALSKCDFEHLFLGNEKGFTK